MDLERIGPYIIDHKIGSGGMGTVFLAQHAETGQDVAVKVLPPALANEMGFVARFEREIESLRKLVNPQIVTLLDSGVEDNTYYYAMEYVEGETLTDRLRREKRLPWREVVRFAQQICSALKSAHDAGIIHRDLKPSNLLLDKENNIKLTDFGVAQVFAAGRLTMTGGIIGTAEYMSPEQAHGKRATKKSDLYSLGAVMYTMLTGRPPFVEKSTLEVIQKHKYGTFDRPSRYAEGIPRRLEETVCQLLEKDPDKRFPDAYVLARRLEEILRRADVADQAETRVANQRSTANGQSAAIRIDDDVPQSAEELGGTLMRDLVRADIEQSLAGSPVSRAFNNTWVLLGLFVLLIAGGVAWFKMVGNQEESISGNIDRAKEFAQLDKAQRDLKSFLRKQPSSKYDPLLLRAMHALEMGDFDQAERYLTNVQSLMENQDYSEAAIAELGTVIVDIRDLGPDNKDAKQLASELLDRADQVKSKNPGEARHLWNLIIEMYAEHPAVQDEVSTARDRLDQQNPQEDPAEDSRPVKNETGERTAL